MPEATFYTLAADLDARGRQAWILRIVEKVTQQKLGLLLRCQDREEALCMDELLWAGRPESFIPHALADEAPSKRPATLITWVAGPQPPAAVLFNLAVELPQVLPPSRLLLLVEGDEMQRAQRRQQWKWLKAQHWQLSNHTLSSTAS